MVNFDDKSQPIQHLTYWFWLLDECVVKLIILKIFYEVMTLMWGILWYVAVLGGKIDVSYAQTIGNWWENDLNTTTTSSVIYEVDGAHATLNHCTCAYQLIHQIKPTQYIHGCKHSKVDQKMLWYTKTMIVLVKYP